MMLGLVTVAVLLALLPGRRLDHWRRILLVATALLLATSAADPATAQMAYTPRLAMVVLLAIATWALPPRTTPAPLTGMPRWLTRTLWSIPVATGTSIIWSINPVQTSAQTIMLTALAAIIHGGLSRRWSTPGDVLNDLAVPYWAIIASFALSLAAYWTDQPGAVGHTGRMHGIFVNPNMIGMLAALTIPLSWALFNHRRSKPYIAGAVLAVVALLLCESRAPLVALAVAAAWVIIRTPSVRLPILKVTYLAALATASYLFVAVVVRAAPLPDLQVSALGRFTADEGGDVLNQRGTIWDIAMSLWLERPLTGYGYGITPELMTGAYASTAYGSTWTSIHNGYLQWLLEMGLFGVLPMALVLFVALAAAWRATTLPAALMGAVVAGGLTVQLAESATFGTGQPFPYLFWMCVAGCALADRRPANAPDSGRPVVVVTR